MWSGVEWFGVVWSGVEWSGVEWSGVEWSGVEWSGVEWCGVEWCGVVVFSLFTFHFSPNLLTYLLRATRDWKSESVTYGQMDMGRC